MAAQKLMGAPRLALRQTYGSIFCPPLPFCPCRPSQPQNLARFSSAVATNNLLQDFSDTSTLPQALSAFSTKVLPRLTEANSPSATSTPVSNEEKSVLDRSVALFFKRLEVFRKPSIALRHYKHLRDIGFQFQPLQTKNVIQAIGVEQQLHLARAVLEDFNADNPENTDDAPW